MTGLSSMLLTMNDRILARYFTPRPSSDGTKRLVTQENSRVILWLLT